MVGNLFDIFSGEKVAFVADTAVSLGIIARVPGAGNALSIDFDVTSLAETAAAEPILMPAADRADERGAALVDTVVDLVISALAAGSIDGVVPERADAGLLLC